MKKFSQLMFATFAFVLLFSMPQLSAQSNATVSQKVTDKEGNVTVKKKRLKEGENVDDYLETLSMENGMNVEVTVMENGNTTTVITSRDVNQSETEMEVMSQAMAELEKEIAKIERVTGQPHEINLYIWFYF